MQISKETNTNKTVITNKKLDNYVNGNIGRCFDKDNFTLRNITRRVMVLNVLETENSNGISVVVYMQTKFLLSEQNDYNMDLIYCFTAN